VNILAIDPGTTKSGGVLITCEESALRPRILAHWSDVDNDELLKLMGSNRLGYQFCAVEGMTFQGRKFIGNETFLACIWAGRFMQRAMDMGFAKCGTSLIMRRQVQINLLGSTLGGDKHIRAAIIERYGGKAEAIGTKSKPGPLYGLTSHAWPALAVALTANDKRMYE